MTLNPFYDLYLAESMSDMDFVTLFSPALVPHVQQVFLPGNVVVVGMQGTGKSMLLTLLKADTRIRYEQAEHDFPVRPEHRRFIACSVNLSHSNATDFGYRDWKGHDPRAVELLFGDFVNALLVCNLVDAINIYQARGSAKLHREIGLALSSNALDALATRTGKVLWNGWLSGVTKWMDLRERIAGRITEYRGFLHRRRNELSLQLRETQSSIGEPVGEFAQLLREWNIIQPHTNVFVDIDQYEELANIRTAEGVDYRSVINRALSRRDPRISYRIGSRHHSWKDHARIMGSAGKLEEERDYKYVDLDLLLKRAENRKTYIFPLFAEDVFKRRMQVAGFLGKDETIQVSQVYGKPLQPDRKAVIYANEKGRPSGKAKTKLSQQSITLLTKLYKKNPLSAKLGEAWLLQKGEIDDLEVRDGLFPWETESAQWWRKERIELALLQLASGKQQRPIYSGDEEIFDLSNGNILVFISINQHIWDEYFKYASRITQLDRKIPFIEVDLQSSGILRASDHWYTKLAEETGRSDERKRFVAEIARFFRERTVSDPKMSYPGAVGFSLRETDLDRFPKIMQFLDEVADYGSLTKLPHTTKEKDRAARFKWYLSPILCPHLKLPYKRVKEPFYATAKDVLGWLTNAGLAPHEKRVGGAQGTLF